MKRCFVISPIGSDNTSVRKHADDVFNYIIQPAMDECGLVAIRSDQLAQPGKISDQMFREIFEADLCIAVLTGRNPNVFYELAVAQSARQPVIILLEKGEPLPFDVQDLRAVQYDLEISSFVKKTYINQVVSNIESLKTLESEPTIPFGKFLPRHSVFIGPPASNPKLDITRINWNKDACFIVGEDFREKIFLVPTGIGPTFEIRISEQTLKKLKERFVRLELADDQGNLWRVDGFFWFQNIKSLIAPEQINVPEEDYE